MKYRSPRAKAKQELLKEPTEPEYDPREYIPEEKEMDNKEVQEAAEAHACLERIGK